MKWSDDYAVGIEFIDKQHQALFRWAENFRAALDHGMGGEAYSEVLYELTVYTEDHFRFEEGCMNEYRCPVAEKNKAAHTKFVETLSGFQQRYDAAGYDREDALRLADTLDEWLADHICHIDIHLKRCVNQ